MTVAVPSAGPRCREPHQNGRPLAPNGVVQCCRAAGHEPPCHLHGMFRVIGLHLYRTAGQSLGCGRGQNMDAA